MDMLIYCRGCEFVIIILTKEIILTIILTKEIHVIGNPETFWLVLNWFHSDVKSIKQK